MLLVVQSQVLVMQTHVEVPQVQFIDKIIDVTIHKQTKFIDKVVDVPVVWQTPIACIVQNIDRIVDVLVVKPNERRWRASEPAYD